MISALSIRRQMLFIFLSAIAIPLAYAQSRCQAETAVFSLRGDKPTTIVFNNNGSGILRIFWIDYAGVRKWYANISPDERHTQPTYASHPWVVTDIRGNCQMVAFSEVGVTSITLGGQ